MNQMVIKSIEYFQKAAREKTQKRTHEREESTVTGQRELFGKMAETSFGCCKAELH